MDAKQAHHPSTGARTNPDADDFWSQAKGALDQFDANTHHRVTELLEANNRYQQEARDARAALRGGFQDRVDLWLLACFGEEIARDKVERNHRFLEESLELAQSAGCTASEAHQLVDYVFGRPVGEMTQEVGGVMNTLAAFCVAHGLDMMVAGETELTRVWGKIEKIRAKQAAKPKHGPLAGGSALVEIGAERRRQVDGEIYDHAHDDAHDQGELAIAAAAFAATATAGAYNNASASMAAACLWPWSPCEKKPAAQRRNLIKAGACIVAEIERLDRASAREDKADA